jgi:hypothetical protein
VKPVFVVRVAALAVIAGFVFACTDRSEFAGPPVVTSGPSISSLNDFSVTCSANIAARTVKCGDPDNGFRNDLILGGQGTYVKLISDNIFVVADTIGFSVDVQNLIAQPIGTSDSTGTPDEDGIRVFFTQGPTSTGAGTITVANPDGVAAFTGPNQPYFRYHSAPLPGEFTGSRIWKLQFSPQVANFTFKVAVSAPVEFQHGYIDETARVLTLNPSESFTLPAKVHNALGTVQNSPVTWSSSNPSVASVVDSTVTGGTFGYSVLTGVSNTRPTASDVYVHTCSYILVSNGTVYSDSVTNADCFSAFHPDDGYLPGTSAHGDLYRLTVSAGQTADISVDTGDGLDSYLVMTDRLGNVVAVNDDDDIGSLSPGSSIHFTATKSGTYVIQVTTFTAGATGNYTLHVVVSGP